MKLSPNEMFSRSAIFEEESPQQALTRYSGFGSGVYELMKSELPHIFCKLSFYRYKATTQSHGDSFAICDSEEPFSIQLDPDCEVIVLGNAKVSTEIGAWFADPCSVAVDFVKDELASTSKS